MAATAAAAAAMSTPDALEGFTALTDQIYIHPGSPETTTSATDPGTIMLFGWGDAQPKHVSKYVAGYRGLFPSSRVVLVFSPILRALLSGLDARTQNMAPVVDAVFGAAERHGSASWEKGSPHSDHRVLAHVMSNTGGINYAAALNAYRTKHGRAMPHDLVVLDSTPGSTDFFPNIGRWSRAMAIGAASWLPWPLVVTQALAAGFLGAMQVSGWLVGRVSAADFSVGAVNDPELESPDARRLYLYSKEDDIIYWEDIEKHAARAVERGFVVDMDLFEGTPHVGHMRKHPERYWADIKTSWEKVVAKK